MFYRLIPYSEFFALVLKKKFLAIFQNFILPRGVRNLLKSSAKAKRNMVFFQRILNNSKLMVVFGGYYFGEIIFSKLQRIWKTLEGNLWNFLSSKKT